MADFQNTALQWIDKVVTGIEILAVIIIAVMIVIATVIYLSRKLFHRQAKGIYHGYRVGLARAILLGLEILIAGDVVRTVVLDLTLVSVGTLGLLVVVRTFLSWSLVVEIDKRWPWQVSKSGQDEEET